MFEFPPEGAVLPSFRVQTLRIDEEARTSSLMNMIVVVIFVLLFMVSEVFDFFLLGPVQYPRGGGAMP